MPAAPGTRSTPIRSQACRGSPRRRSSAGSGWPVWRRRGASASCAMCAPTSSSAAGATSPGRCSPPPGCCASPRHCSVDAHLGLANRLGAPFARRVFLAFPIPGKDPPRYQVTGRPVPRAVLKGSAEEGRREFDLPADRPVVLVFGGSLGSTTINRSAAAAWAASDPGFTVVHITGERELAPQYSGRAAPHYRVLAWTSALGPLLAAADIVVSRAGGSVFEIAAAGKPAVLVPSPNVTADHQSLNAAHFADSAAIVVEDAELTAARLDSEVEVSSPSLRGWRRCRGRPPARPADAAERIATTLLTNCARQGLAERRLHMVGVGGARDGPRRHRLLDGCRSTAAIRRRRYARQLERFGVRLAEGHDRAHLEERMDVVVSSAVPADADEVLEARVAGLAVIHRAELLAEMVAARRSICVGGAHGKTTTTAMIAYGATRLGFDPTWLVGGDVPQLGGNAEPEAASSSSLRPTSSTARARSFARGSRSSPTSSSTITTASVGNGPPRALCGVGRERPGRRRCPLGRRR